MSFIAILSFIFVILSFLSANNGVLQSNKPFFVEKVQKDFVEKIPQINFCCILIGIFSKIFKFFVNRAPLAPKSGSTPPTSRKKFGGRLPVITELQPSTVVFIIVT